MKYEKFIRIPGLSQGICAQSFKTISEVVNDKKTKKDLLFSIVYLLNKSTGEIAK
ncbi:MAG: hypothetical protein AAGI25_11135 [Bacteroidota bacterium]